MTNSSPETTSTAGETIDAVVVGAGFGGMYALHRLRQLGLKAQAYETGGGVGGTWYWNRYPGARCDAPSLNYCYSFSPELLEDWHWTETYAAQPEIEAYANHVADRFDLRRDIQFNTRVTSATWDDSTRTWTVETDMGDVVKARYLFMCTGCYSAPITSSVPGLDTFEGDVYYSSSWPTEPVDLSGKRIGVIGTGSSGVQSVAGIAAEDVEHLYVFQRSANFILPSNNAPTDPLEEREIKDRYAEIWQRLKWSGQGVDYGEVPIAAIGEMSDEEFEDYMREAWPRGGPLIVLGITDTLKNESANRRLADHVNAKMREAVHDQAVAELVTAKNQYWGTRRLIIASGYYEALNQPNVTLVDVSSSPVEICPSGVRTGDSIYDLDMIVLATGFDTGTGPLSRIDIRGLDGLTIQEKWSSGIDTYLGATLAGFPNMFVIAGPGSPSIRSNMILSIQQHVDWCCDLVLWMAEHDVASVEPTTDAERAWTDHVAEVANATILTKDDTPYVGANVPGKPRVYLCYVGGVGLFRQICEDIAANGYEGMIFHSEKGAELVNGRQWGGPPIERQERVGSRVI